jgi:hypothetical protein
VRRLLAVLALAVLGCSGETSALLHIDLATGLAQPDSLRVSLFGDGPIGAPQPISLVGKRLPGDLVVRPLDPPPPKFRVLVDALDGAGGRIGQAAGYAALETGRQHRTDLVVKGSLDDRDGDGIPDDIDDCPTTPDPRQDCAAPGTDGGAADLPSVVDLASDQGAIDLAGPDQTPPPPDDAAVDGGTCPANALMCDDFESGAFASPWVVMPATAHANVAVEGSRAVHGAFSAHVTTLNDSTGDQPYASRVFGTVSSGTLALRAWVRVDQAFDGPFYFLMVGAAYNIGWDTQAPSPGLQVYNLSGNGAYYPASAQLTVGKPTCVELVIDIVASPLSNRVRLFLDGSPVVDAQSAPAMAHPSITDVQLGVTYASDNAGALTGTNSIWIDDLVIATAQVGCN